MLTRLFIGHVSPHELLQVIATESNKQFRIGVQACLVPWFHLISEIEPRLHQQSDPLQFLSWFLNRLHMQLGGTRARGSSIIYRTFQGEVRVETYTPAIGTTRVLPNRADRISCSSQCVYLLSCSWKAKAQR